MSDRLTVRDIQAHYDQLALFYWLLWGEHIHHGYWEDEESELQAQVKLIERLAALARIPGGARVLDVGCGFGGAALWLAENYHCHVTGITLSPIQAWWARHRARRKNLHRQVTIRRGDVQEQMWPDASFDVIWVIECSEHLEDKRRFFESCSRWLAPAGILALSAWMKGENLTAEDERNSIEPVCRGFLCPSLATLSEYGEWLREAGIEIVAFEDATERIIKTWEICRRRTEHPLIRWLLPWASPSIRRFVDSFATIQSAFLHGALIYGMMAGQKRPWR